MTIGKQLYKSFGLVLVTLFVLLLVDVVSIWIAHSASDDARNTLESLQTIEKVRSQIMQNRLNLNNFLLSGDPRDEDKVNKGFTDLADAVKNGQSQTSRTGDSTRP